jgi:hypothetical protein
MQGLPLKNTTRWMWAAEWEGGDFFTSRRSVPLQLFIPHARNFVLCLSIYISDINMNVNKQLVESKIRVINSLIEKNASIDAYTPHFKQLTQLCHFTATSILNEHFYRARKDNGILIDNVCKIKYPPPEFAGKGRLNDNGESVTYLSSSELTTIAELDIGYFDIYCVAKIAYLKKDIIFHPVGVRTGTIKNVNELENGITSFYKKLITTKDKRVYNATTALARILLSSKGFRAGILYSSVQEDKSNKNLFNLAVKPQDFDDCCKIVELEYNTLKYSPVNDEINIHTLNVGTPLADGTISWQYTYDKMIELNNWNTKEEVYRVGKGIVHYKHGGGPIESETISSFLVRFTRTNQVIEVLKSELRN